jgi:hypothetical protein
MALVILLVHSPASCQYKQWCISKSKQQKVLHYLVHHCSSHESERYFFVGFGPCPTPRITSAIWHQTARPHTVHWACFCVTCYRLTRSVTIAWYSMVESPCARLPPCLITYFSTIVTALRDWFWWRLLAWQVIVLICLSCFMWCDALYVVRCTLCSAMHFQSFNVFCALRDFFFFF